MDVLLTLSDYQAVLIHVHATVCYDSCMNMARYFEAGEIPTFARVFYEEAAQWKEIGLRIEAQKPGIHPGEWRD